MPKIMFGEVGCAGRPFGLNLGGNEFDGAGVLLSNMIPNPGFEPSLFRMRSQVEKGSTLDRIVQRHVNPSWGGGIPPEHYWDNAQVRLETGDGEQYLDVISHTYEGVGDGMRNVYHLSGNLEVPITDWTQFVLSKKFFGSLSANVRIGSEGKHCLAKEPIAENHPLATYYWDMYGMQGYKDAGSMFNASGVWRLRVWLRSHSGLQQVRIMFGRLAGGTSFYDGLLNVGPEWAEYTILIPVDDPVQTARPIKGLSLSLYNKTQKEPIYIDDMWFGLDSDYGTTFNKNTVDAIKSINPSCLLYHGGQYGRDFEYEVGSQYSRGRNEFRTSKSTVGIWSYNLPEFLTLCRDLEVTPWFCIPSSFGINDVSLLKLYLEENWPWDLKIILEAGKENWGSNSGGDPFMGASFGSHQAYAKWAKNTLTRLADISDAVLVMGGQAGWSGAQDLIIPELVKVPKAPWNRAIALAPYYGRLQTANTLEEKYYPLYAQLLLTTYPQAWETFRKQTEGKCLRFVYETNFHTDNVSDAMSTIPNEEETDADTPSTPKVSHLETYTAGRAGGLALPLQLLSIATKDPEAILCPYQLVQHSVGPDYARIWGLVRDLHNIKTFRPSLVILSELNHLLDGTTVVYQCSVDGAPMLEVPQVNGVDSETLLPSVWAWAIDDGEGITLVVFNLSMQDIQTIQVPDTHAVINVRTLTGEVESTNETTELVALTTHNVSDALHTTFSIGPANVAFVTLAERVEYPPTNLTKHITIGSDSSIREGIPSSFEFEHMTIHLVSTNKPTT